MTKDAAPLIKMGLRQLALCGRNATHDVLLRAPLPLAPPITWVPRRLEAIEAARRSQIGETINYRWTLLERR